MAEREGDAQPVAKRKRCARRRPAAVRLARISRFAALDWISDRRQTAMTKRGMHHEMAREHRREEVLRRIEFHELDVGRFFAVLDGAAVNDVRVGGSVDPMVGGD
jgi:hypothetical protein